VSEKGSQFNPMVGRSATDRILTGSLGFHPSLAFEWVNYTLSMIICQYNAKVLIQSTGRKKFTLAKTCIFAYNSSMKFEKDTKMQKQFALLPIRLQSAMLKELRVIHAQCRADYKAGKELLKADRAAAKAEKAAAAIAKAQARLDKLLAKQVGAVGTKAAKANRKPSKVTTYGAEDNQIASAIMAKKASA
jgi:hypothetical protein